MSIGGCICGSCKSCMPEPRSTPWEATELFQKMLAEYTENGYQQGVREERERAKTVDRFEVIDSQGRIYVKYDVSIELSYQDGDKTLKVFVEDMKND